MKTPNDDTRAPRTAVDMYLNAYVDDHPFLAQAVNISTSGLLLNRLTAPEHPPATVLTLEMMLPNFDDRIWAQAVVARRAEECGQECLGLRFTHLPERSRECIEAFVGSDAPS